MDGRDDDTWPTGLTDTPEGMDSQGISLAPSHLVDQGISSNIVQDNNNHETSDIVDEGTTEDRNSALKEEELAMLTEEFNTDLVTSEEEPLALLINASIIASDIDDVVDEDKNVRADGSGSK
jgi:hypothetical protein